MAGAKMHFAKTVCTAGERPWQARNTPLSVLGNFTLGPLRPGAKDLRRLLFSVLYPSYCSPRVYSSPLGCGFPGQDPARPGDLLGLPDYDGSKVALSTPSLHSYHGGETKFTVAQYGPKTGSNKQPLELGKDKGSLLGVEQIQPSFLRLPGVLGRHSSSCKIRGRKGSFGEGVQQKRKVTVDTGTVVPVPRQRALTSWAYS